MPTLAEFLENKKLIALVLTIALLIFIAYASLPFLSAFFGAGILAFIFRPLDKKLRSKGLSKRQSAIIILIISIFLVIIPLIFVINGLIKQISLLPAQISKIRAVRTRIEEITNLNINIDLTQIFQDQIFPIIKSSITPIFSNILNAVIILFLLFFLLYYFIIYSDKFKELILTNLPFSLKSNEKIIDKFKQVTYSTIIGTFFIAIIQGGLITLNFYLLGIPNAIFWGFVAAILSFIPIIGPPVIWIPAAIILLISGGIAEGITLIIVGFLISLIDNILRPIINDKYGSIHPLISIIGLYIGISQFGIIGLFIGPLLVAYLILFWELYKEEFYEKNIVCKEEIPNKKKLQVKLK